VWAGISGLFLGLFVGLDLLLLGVVPLDSVVLVLLPPAGLVLSVVLALWAPFGRSRLATTVPGPAAMEPAPPVATAHAEPDDSTVADTTGGPPSSAASDDG
jgi:hypothetical protein